MSPKKPQRVARLTASQKSLMNMMAKENPRATLLTHPFSFAQSHTALKSPTETESIHLENSNIGTHEPIVFKRERASPRIPHLINPEKQTQNGMNDAIFSVPFVPDFEISSSHALPLLPMNACTAMTSKRLASAKHSRLSLLRVQRPED